MPDNNYLDILREISDWRAVPCLKYGPLLLKKMDSLLRDIPHFFMRNGDIFLGAKDISVIDTSGVCLCSRLSNAGGPLRFGEDDKYLHCRIKGYPYPKKLLGRRFGVYPSHGGEKICELETEQVYHGKEQNSLYFFADNQKAAAIKNAGETVMCHPSDFRADGGIVSSWNLSSLINTALIIYLLKEKHKNGGLSGLISFNNHFNAISRKGFVRGLNKAGVLLAGLDVFENEKIKEPFGYISAEDPRRGDPLRGDISALSGNAGPIAVYLKIKNKNNGNSFNRFEAEEVPCDRLGDYIDFVSALIKPLTDFKSAEESKKSEYGKIEIINEAPEIAGIVLGAGDFAGFLSSGMLKISAIFGKHGMVRAEISHDAFEEIRTKLKSRAVSTAVEEAVLTGWIEDCLKKIRKLFPAGTDFDEGNIKIVNLLMGNSPAFQLRKNGNVIFISRDKAACPELKKPFLQELVYCLAENGLRSSPLSPDFVKYYCEGLKYALSAEILNISLAESLGLTNSRFQEYNEKTEELRAMLRSYLSGDMLYLYEGKYHKYFKKKGIFPPYESAAGKFARYGGFLAAVEVRELLVSGKFYEKTLR